MSFGTTIIQVGWQEAELRPFSGWAVESRLPPIRFRPYVILALCNSGFPVIEIPWRPTSAHLDSIHSVKSGLSRATLSLKRGPWKIDAWRGNVRKGPEAARSRVAQRAPLAAPLGGQGACAQCPCKAQFVKVNHICCFCCIPAAFQGKRKAFVLRC